MDHGSYYHRKTALIRNSHNKGFTLIETLVAVGILGLVISSVAGLLQISLRLAADYKQTLAAGMLAQEGLELVRYKRDSNRLKDASGIPTNWMNELLPTPCQASNGCEAVMNSGTGVVTFTAYAANDLRLDAATGIFNYTSGSPTGFKRRIVINNLAANEVRVTVTVTWPGIFTSFKTIQVQDNLLDWQGGTE